MDMAVIKVYQITLIAIINYKSYNVDTTALFANRCLVVTHLQKSKTSELMFKKSVTVGEKNQWVLYSLGGYYQ